MQGIGKGTVGLFNFISDSVVTSAHAEPSPLGDQANKVMFTEADGDKGPGWQNDVTGLIGNGVGTLADRSDGVAGVTALLSWGQPLASSPSLEAPAAAGETFTPAPPIATPSSNPWYYNPYQAPPPADTFTGFPGGVDPFLVTPQGNPYAGTGSYLVGYFADGTPAYRHVETAEEAFPNGVDPFLVAPIIQAPSNNDPMVYINVPGGTSYMEPYSEYYNNNFVNPNPSSFDYIGTHYSPTYSSESYSSHYSGSSYSGSSYSGSYSDSYYSDSYFADSYYSDSYFADSYYSVGGDFSGGGDFGGGDFSGPVILDLTGKGVSITQLGSSNHYFSFGGDGLQEATAWAGAGNGVLAIDLNGSGNINQPDEINFSLWDPTAKSDMQALLDVFDTNHDGQLDAGDADWSKFGLIVTNADGTTQFETLSQLGITAINLTSNNQTTFLPDGSSIVGETTFTRSDGSTGTAADVTLAHDASGHLVETTTTVNADGSTTIDNKALNSSGSLANETISTTSADGKTVTISRDTAGNGVINSIQTDVTVDNADGSTTLTVTNFDGTASHVLNRTVTINSADLKTTTIDRDHTGGGFFNQVEVDAKNAAGDLTATVGDYNPDGSLRDQTVTTTGASGLSKTTQVDSTGDGVNDRTQSDMIVVNADGSRTETVSDANADGSLRKKTVTQTSADGQNKTIEIDNAGVGSFDTNETEVIVRNADGSTTTTQQVLNANSSLRHEVVTTLSADGLSKTTQTDSTGAGTFDLVTTDVTVQNADGSTTETVTDRNADGSLRDRSIKTWSADGKTRTIQADTTGDDVVDAVETVAAGTSGASVDTVSHFNADSSLKSRTVTTTSASGLSVTTQQDTTGALDGSGNVVFDQTRTDLTVLNANGSSTETVAHSSANGTLVDETVTTTSANGLSITTQQDTTGAMSGGSPIFDRTRTDVTVLNADGSQTETLTDTSTNSTMLDRTVTTTSADRRTATIQVDSTGDNYVSELRTRNLNLDGSLTLTVKDASANGTLESETVTTTSANGLSITTQQDTTGALNASNPLFDHTRTDVTVLNANGSRTKTVTDTSANGTLEGETVTTTSANGLSVTTQQDTAGAVDGSGNPVFDRIHTDVTVLNADGSRTETAKDASANGTLEGETVMTTSANGLSITNQQDVTGAANGGNPVFDRTRTDVTALNADGSKTETVTDTSANGTVLDRTVTTTSSDRRTTTTQVDSTGDNYFSEVRTTVVNADGSVTSTVKDASTDGTLEAESVTTTSANGLSTTTQQDATGALNGSNPVFDQIRADVTVLNADGSKTETVRDTSANGTLVDEAVVTTSANGLSVTTQQDITGAMNAGNPVFDQTRTDVTVLSADGSKTETVTDTSASGTLLDRTITTTSADRRSTTTQTDSTGDNYFSQVQTRVVNADGSVTLTVKGSSASGALEAETVTTTSANGLSTTTQLDATGAVSGGNPVFDHTRTDIKVVNADGSKTETVTDTSANGTMLDQTVTTTSANGLSITAQQDATGAVNGAGHPVFDHTRTDVTVLNADGSKTETVTDTSANGTMLDATVTTTSANGLTATKQQDVTGAVNGSGNPVFDLTRTDVTVLNADGSKTETIADTSANGTMLDRTVTMVSADGRTTTIQIDSTGDGYFNEVRTRVVNADGSATLTVRDISADSTLEDETVATTSANGLSVTTERDTAGAVSGGNPVFDQIRTDVTVLNADGSKTETVTDTSTNGTLVDETIKTTSANGLAVTTQTNITGAVSGGAPVFDETHTDVTVLNADGSKTETVTDTSTNGSLLDRTVTSLSTDRRTTTIQIDSTGDNYFGEVRTGVVNGDGSVTLTVKDASANGTLQAESVTTTSANGFSVTTQQDTTGAISGGNPVFDQSRADVTVLNADGSKTETVTDTSTNGALLDKTVKTTSANGLSITTQQDTTGALSGGNPVFDQTRTDLTVLNPDGSKTRAVTDTSANGTMLDRTVTTRSANGLSITTQQDTTGAMSGSNPVFDRTRSDVTTLNADGSQTEVVTTSVGDGSLRSKTMTTTSADQKQVSISRDTNGDSVVDQTELDTVAADGSRTRTVSDYSVAGALLDRAAIMTSANGLSVTTRRDTTGALDGSGNAVFDQIRTDVTSLNADGSTTETVSDTNAAGVVQDRAVVITGSNGLLKTTEEDTTGSNSFGLIEADVTVLNANGSTSETVTDTNSSRTLLRKTTATISADGKTKTISRDLNGDGVADQTGTFVVTADGSTVSTLSDFNANGTLKDNVVETTSANGLSVTTQRDTTGSGSVNQTRTDVVVLGGDGSRTETISNYNASGSLTDQTVKTVGANGLSTSASWTASLPASSTSAQSDVVVINADGSRTETLINTGSSGAMTSERVVITSANGLSKTLEWDTSGAVDGSGHPVFDQTLTDVTTVNADGSRVEVASAYGSGGGLMSKTTGTTSADGRTVTAASDTNGDGTVDQIKTTFTVRNADGSSIETVTDYDANGLLKDRSVTTTSADGRTVTAKRDADGDGVTDQTQTTVTAIDGSKVDTITDLGRLGVVEDQAITTISADGLTRTAQWDFAGSGTADRTRSDVIVKNLDGSITETITDVDGSGVLYQKAILTRSADGRTKTVQKQTPGQSYLDYSEVTTTAVDGSSKTVAEYLTETGAVFDQAIMSVSADGLTETVQQDSSGSGTFNYNATTHKNIDGSTITNASYLNAGGQTIERVVTTVSPDGLVTTIEKDSTNAGWFDSINTIVARPDGSTVSTTRYLNSSGATTSELVTITSADGNIVTQSVPPVIGGTQAGQTTTSEQPDHPFSGAYVHDLNPGATDVLTITLGGAGGTLSGAGLGGSGNTYTLSGSASTITSELEALVFTPNAGQPNTSGTTTFRLSDASTGYTPKILTSFDGTTSKEPEGGLIEDAAGNLFGTTSMGGDGRGDVFVLPKIGDGYSSTPVVLFNFGVGGNDPNSTLTMDAAGNLFTVTAGGPANDGTVVELVRSGGSFTANTIAIFNGSNGNGPEGKLVADASGNLFGETAAGGASNKGTLFEIAKSGSTYSGPLVLTSFNGTNGNEPSAVGLAIDAAGNLFGTTVSGGANDEGTIFELARGSSTITTLYSFSATSGFAGLTNGVIVDAAGDLFGITLQTRSGGGGAVVELAKTSSGYSTTLTTLATMSDGFGPSGALVMDSAGNLFGATGGGGTDGDGTVFEVVKTASGYSSTAITLTSFDLANGAVPNGGLIIDPNGNLIGMTAVGGANEAGVIFEIPARPAAAITTTDVTTTVTNTDPPAPPVVTITSAAEASSVASQTITGVVTSADATVAGQIVTLKDNGTTIGTATVQSNGTFSASITLPSQGTNSIVASVMDSLGLTGTSAAVVDLLDSVAPTITISSAAEASRNAAQTITGTVTSGGTAAVVGRSVTLTDNGTAVGTATVQSNGTFSATVTLPNQGSNSLVATVSDSYGNTGSSAALVDTLDNVAPTITIGSAAEASNVATQTITGTVVSGGVAAVVGQTVSLTDNGVMVGTATVQSDGTFSASVTLPNQGTNAIVATVADSYGNIGHSAAVTDTLDNVAPTVTITSAAEASKNASQIITGTVVSGGVASVVGQTVTLTENGITLGTATVASNGTFTASVTLNPGLDPIVATVTDSYGNTGSSAAVVDRLEVPPTITGTTAGQTTTSQVPLNPFTGVSIGDLNIGATDTLTITLSGAGGTLSGTGLSGSGNTYTLSGTAAAITVELDALVFTPITGTPNTNNTTTFTLSDASTEYTTPGYAPGAPTTLFSFNGSSIGKWPETGLISDAAGDLFGRAGGGGVNNAGTIFEMVKSGNSYGAPILLASALNSGAAFEGLTLDAAGNLFGTTYGGGFNGYGTVFEIAKSGGGYSSTQTLLATFNSSDGGQLGGGLIADAAGNLYGTAVGNGGTVFEIVKSGGSYDSTPLVLAPLGGNVGSAYSVLTMDAAGDLFGTSQFAGTNGDGTVFEITKTGGHYNATPNVLVTFNGTNGNQPEAGLIMDAAGDLFGTTDGNTVFEIVRSGGSYASTPTILASFTGANGSQPQSSLVMDAAGDLFGTTLGGGAYGDGVLYEIAKSGGSYSATPIVLTSFNVSDGQYPLGSLTINAAGDLIGATEEGGSSGYGVVFDFHISDVPVATIDSTTTVINSNPPVSPTVTITSAAEASKTATQTISGTVTSPDATVAGQTVTLKDNGTVVGTATVQSNGSFSVSVTLPNQGANSLVATVTDSLGLTGTSAAVIDMLDNVAPTIAISSAAEASNAAAQAISGTVVSGGTAAVVGQTVTLKDNGTTLATTTVQADGSFSVAVTLPNQGTNTLVAAVSDSYGNSGSSAAVVDTLDNIAPTVTISSAAEASNVAAQTISGTVVSGGVAVVVGQTVILKDNGVTLGTATVQPNGTFSATVTLPNQGTNSIVATVSDSYGNSGSSAAVVDSLDNVAPTVTVNSAAEASNIATQTISGTVSSGGTATVVGRTVTLTDNGVALGTATIQANGTFSASVTLPNQGTNSIVATVTDSYGNVGSSVAVVYTLDNIAPTVTLTSPAEASNVAAQTITGTVASNGVATVVGQTVTLKDNGVTLGTATVQSDGTFSAAVALPNQGTNSIVAIVTDSYGNIGSSAAVVDALDSVAPTVTITSGSEISNSAAQTISGTVTSGGTAAVIGQTVTLTDNGTVLGTTTVQSNGTFSAAVTLPNQGANSIVATVTDSYGNTGNSAAVVDTLDTMAPAATISSAAEASNVAAQTISGTVVPGGSGAVVGRTVTLTDNGVTLGTATVQSNGTFSANVTLSNQGSNSIVATVTDSLGNTGSSAAIVDTLDNIAPTVTITSAAEASLVATQTITGTVSLGGAGAVVGQTVTLTDNGAVLGTATVQSNGTFSVAVTLPNPGANSLVATVSDSYGNTGNSAAVVDTLGSTAPTITGTIAAQATSSQMPVHPFSGVTIGDLNIGATDTLTITLSGAGGTLSGTGLSGSGSTYTLSGTAATITSQLNALVFTPTAGAPNTNGTTTFKLSDASTAYFKPATFASAPTVLASFNGTTGAYPVDGLIADAAGNLFGTTSAGGANNQGAVFEITKTGGTYSSTPTVLASFNGTNGNQPYAGSLIMDAAGNLFGTTHTGGANSDGTVFEIVKTGSSYSSTPTVLVSFNGTNGGFPFNGLIMDSAGDLFGTTYSGGTSNFGTVFEIVKTGGSYSSSPTILTSFNGTNGRNPETNLIMDAAGDLFGTTLIGGASNDGTVFEIVKSGGSYSSTPTVLASFNGTNGLNPQSGLIMDAAGNLFGTTNTGGANNVGALFEIVKSGGGYSSTPTVLASFSSSTGLSPQGQLIMDAAGDLFGTTTAGGAISNGTLFELVKTASGYSSTLTVLSSLNGTNGASPGNVLSFDAAGDLLGTAQGGGANSKGTVIELVATSTTPVATVDSTTTVINSTPPVPPTVTITSAAEVVSVATQTIAGTVTTDASVVGKTVTLTDNGIALGTTTVAANGTFSLNVTLPNQGSNSIVASVTDSLGLTGTSAAVVDTLDPAATITGTQAGQTTTSQAPVHPFAGVTIGDPNGATNTLTITLSGAGGTLSGTGLSGSGSVYTLSGSASVITSELDALVFTPTAGLPNTSNTTNFKLSDTSAAMPAYAGTPTVLTSFNGTNGASLQGNLIADSAGDLFGTTYSGGANNDGTVFEIIKSGSSYSSTPTVLASFNNVNGNGPAAGLIMDSAGNLFGTTGAGGTNSEGTIFEIAKSGGGYSSTPTVLASFNGTNGQDPTDNLIMDSAGDLFGTTQRGGTSNTGTVFELVKGNSAPTVLASFNGTSGVPFDSLIMDSAGNLFGTIASGGANSFGGVFEIVKSGGSYSSTPTLLASFNNVNGNGPTAGLIMDSAGDLFGTATYGGTSGNGTVFELIKSGGSYSSTPTLLATFNGTNGSGPRGNLIMDSAGDLLGTTIGGGANGYGDVFEIVKSGSSYSSTPTVLNSFSGANGQSPVAGLLIDAAGNLLGTTENGGVNNDGVVFQLSSNATVDSTTTVINNDPSVAPTVTITSAAEVVSVTTQTIAGTVSSPDATVAGKTVTLTDNGTVLGTTTVASNGTFSLNVTLPNQGSNSIVASVTDSLGLTGTSSAVVDTLDPAATITGTQAGQTTTSQAPVHPFSGVTIGDPNGATNTLTITLSGAGGTLSGTGLSGSGSVYTLSGSASVITSELDALVFTPTTGLPNTSNTTNFKLSDTSAAMPAYAGTPTVLTSFNGTNGASLQGNLIADSAGDLFGTTYSGGANNDGTVFEIIKSGSSYSSTPTVLASFNGTNGSLLYDGLVMDSAGNLFGTTGAGGPNNEGTVFEIVKSGGSYSSTPTVLASFNGTNGQYPTDNLIMDSAGDLFGTAERGGTSNAGLVFEIVKSGGSYISTPTVLASFNGTTNGAVPADSLILDSAGNLFGTVEEGGASSVGGVFEIVKSGGSYSSTPTLLASFNGANGNGPTAGLIMDSAGDLFGATGYGGSSGNGTVFEIVKSGGSYSSTPTVLASFNGTNGSSPRGNLIMDSAGDLLGTTAGGGANGYGDVFEIVKSGSSYSSTPTVLNSFSGANGQSPVAGLLIDAAGNLLGTTENGGANNDGVVFQLSSNATVDSTTTVVNNDPPVAPTVTITSAAEASKTASQTIAGTVSSPDAAVVGKIVTLTDNGTAIGTTTVAANGTFSVNVTLPNQGSNSIVASVTDSLGLTGTSAAVVDTLDSIAPSLTISSAPVPTNTAAQTVSGSVTSGGAATVVGRTVTLTDNGSALATATIQSNGTFSTSVTLPNQANNAILASVTDSYGNTNNTYLATTGSGQIAIAAQAGKTNDLDFTGGITDQKLWLLQSGNDLKIDILGTTTSVTATGWFSSSANQFQEIAAGGLNIDSQVSQLVQAMATYSSGHSGFDPTATNQVMPTDTSLQNAIAGAWHA